MKAKLLALGLLAASSVIASQPSFAQGIEIGPNGVRVLTPETRDRDRDMRRPMRQEREISERQAVRIARSEGLSEVDSVTKTRSQYRVAGVDRRGDDIRVDIDRFTGEVLRVR
ncbi:PepSY domain-containing protein [Consotaella salsifontis]|uniref:Peptidase propeptide and YPEB domain-containing protein n=1 Tax=Consotaella salsifontis TaxID=1365950 RepID=A0A1T4NX84_9HYPH|nr:PepSY domain-containing protein [Consotaella salsifontis]SJZ83662.1 Peptidase propeptide and YPEB domain-containing protein [Consotaella salsifontis]